MHPLETYLTGLRGNSLATGVTSNYPLLHNLFNAYGKQLDAEVAYQPVEDFLTLAMLCSYSHAATAR